MFENRSLLTALALATASTLLLSPTARAADSAAKGANAPAVASEPQVPKLSAAQIVEKHVTARGGAQAWKAVQSLQLSGKMEAGKGDNIARAEKMLGLSAGASGKRSNAEVEAASADLDAAKQILLPFTLDLKRPKQMRLEIVFDGKTAVQVFDGTQGWKYRPYLNRKDVEPYTKDEASAEANHDDLDGPLIDYAAKGSKLDVEGSDLVDAKPAYRLKLSPKHGPAKHIWIDAQTFLDVKVEGLPRRMDGALHPVYVYQRDFRLVNGVNLPFEMETAVDGYPETHKMLIEKATINPAFDAAVFAKPRS